MFCFSYTVMHIMHLRNLLYLNKYYIAQHISFGTKHMHMQTPEQFFVTRVSRKEMKVTHSPKAKKKNNKHFRFIIVPRHSCFKQTTSLTV